MNSPCSSFDESTDSDATVFFSEDSNGEVKLSRENGVTDELQSMANELLTAFFRSAPQDRVHCAFCPWSYNFHPEEGIIPNVACLCGSEAFDNVMNNLTKSPDYNSTVRDDLMKYMLKNTDLFKKYFKSEGMIELLAANATILQRFSDIQLLTVKLTKMLRSFDFAMTNYRNLERMQRGKRSRYDDSDSETDNEDELVSQHQEFGVQAARRIKKMRKLVVSTISPLVKKFADSC